MSSINDSFKLVTSDNDLAAAVETVGIEYGLNAYVIRYNLGEGNKNNGTYIIVGRDENVLEKSPVELIQRAERSPSLFYTDGFAIKADNVNQMELFDKLTHYCSRAEATIYGYTMDDMPVPTVLRMEEVAQDYRIYSHISNPDFDSDAKQIYLEQLKKGAEADKHMGSLKRAWIKFCRTEKYDIDKSFLYNLRTFLFHRTEQNVPLERLIVSGGKLMEEDIQEHEYEVLKHELKKYPDILYNVGKKDVIDYGKIKDDKKNPWKDEKSYWEFREFTFRPCDEPIIAGILTKIRLGYADTTRQISNDTVGVYIPVNDMRQFDYMCKSNGISYSIDTTGYYNSPSLDGVTVVIHKLDVNRVNAMISNISTDKILFSHALNERMRDRLDDAIRDAKTQSSKQQNKGFQKIKPFELV